MEETSYKVRQEATARILNAYNQWLTQIIEVEKEAVEEAEMQTVERKQVVKQITARSEEEAKENS